MGEKQCTKCQEHKPTDDFASTKKTRSGLRGACRPCNNEQEKARYQFVKLTALARLGNKCSWCEFDDVRALQIDHINGGGSKEFRDIGAKAVYLKVAFANDISEYQCLCANCNWIKEAQKRDTIWDLEKLSG